MASRSIIRRLTLIGRGSIRVAIHSKRGWNEKCLPLMTGGLPIALGVLGPAKQVLGPVSHLLRKLSHPLRSAFQFIQQLAI